MFTVQFLLPWKPHPSLPAVVLAPYLRSNKNSLQVDNLYRISEIGAKRPAGAHTCLCYFRRTFWPYGNGTRPLWWTGCKYVRRLASEGSFYLHCFAGAISLLPLDSGQMALPVQAQRPWLGAQEGMRHPQLGHDLLTNLSKRIASPLVSWTSPCQATVTKSLILSFTKDFKKILCAGRELTHE